MHVTPNVERLKRLRVDGYAMKAQIAFCPTCDFQYEPQTLGPSQCPDCGTHLHVTTMSEELQALVQSQPKNKVTLTTFQFACETCGHPIEIVQFPDGHGEVRPHYYCDTPRFAVMTDNPRKLGVIHGLT